MSGETPVHFTSETIQQICVSTVAEWKTLKTSDIEVVQLVAGLTNQLFKVSVREGVETPRRRVLFRVFGITNGCFYETEFERGVFRVLSSIDKNFAPSLVGEFNGGRIEEWIEGAPLPVEYGRCAAVLHEVGNTIMRFHAISSDPRFPKALLERPLCQFTRIEDWRKQALAMLPSFPAASRAGQILAKYNVEYRMLGVEHLKNILCLKDAKNPVLVDLKGEVYEPCPYMMRVLFAHNDCQENNIMRPMDYNLPDHETAVRAQASHFAHESHARRANRAYSIAAAPAPATELSISRGLDGRFYMPSSAPVVDGQDTSDIPVPPCWLTNAKQACTCVPCLPQALDSEKPSLRLIDFEYADVNFAGFDLATYLGETIVDYLRSPNPKTIGYACSPEGMPSTSLKRELVRAYLQAYFSTVDTRDEQPSEYEVERAVKTVDRLILISHHMWIWWSIIRTAQQPDAANTVGDFDFLTYGLTRSQQYDALVKKLNLPKAGEEHLIEEHLQRLSQEKHVDVKCKTGCTQM